MCHGIIGILVIRPFNYTISYREWIVIVIIVDTYLKVLKKISSYILYYYSSMYYVMCFII